MTFKNRTNIAIVGRMNSGKSTVMNLLTQTDTSIVDPTAGTTADTKSCAIEIHGLGKVMLFDTAGIDEDGSLGKKKKSKVFNVIKESDITLLVVDSRNTNITEELFLLNESLRLGKKVLVLYNLFTRSIALNKKHPEFDSINNIRLNANDKKNRQKLINFILNNYNEESLKTNLLPFIKRNEYYILNIPMDSETPVGRYLRPQNMVEEFITRNFAYPVSYRMDLKKARGTDSKDERKRFYDFLKNFKKKPHVIITDSQAMDIMSKWVPENILLTTFSIVMINYFSSGNLKSFVEGLKVLKKLKRGDRILIVEACNHSRIGEDIGTVQIPKYINKHFPGVKIEHSFGKEFIEGEYKLAIHCGGCMITPQKMQARINDFIKSGIPFTNYGLFLSYIQGKKTLQRVLKPWKIKSI